MLGKQNWSVLVQKLFRHTCSIVVTALHTQFMLRAYRLNNVYIAWGEKQEGLTIWQLYPEKLVGDKFGPKNTQHENTVCQRFIQATSYY